MSKHTNLKTVYSPAGEPFETSTANARDLVTHAQWSYTAPQGGVAPAPTEEAEDDTSTPAAGEGGTPAEQTETEAGEGEGEAGDEGEAEEVTEATFEGQTRDEVAAWLAGNFPDFKPHHKAGVDSLIAKAVELSNAE